MAIPIILDTFQWKSKKAALDAFQQILRGSGYAVYDRVTDEGHDRMLRELVRRHPDAEEKVGAGIDHFFIGKTSDGDLPYVADDAIGIWIRRTDGSAVDFSYQTAIRNDSAMSNAKEGMRRAVEDRRLAYRDRRFAGDGPVTSDVSSTTFGSRAEACVIYITPTWGQLTSRFAEQEGGWQNLLVHSGAGSIQIGSELLDTAVKERWIAFYDRHARPGLATSSESAKRPKQPDSGWAP